MTTALVIITDSLRESNTIPLGAVPNTNQVAEGLRRLKALVASVYGADVGAPLVDWPVGVEDYQDSMSGWSESSWAYPRANSRLICNLGAATTVYFPLNPQDGARMSVVDRAGNFATYNLTVHGNGRTIEDALSKVLNTSATKDWFYRADQGTWVAMASLADENAAMPFPEEFDDYFVTKLAMRTNPQYGRAMSAESATRLVEMQQQIMARYRQTRSVHADPSVLVTNRTTYGRPTDPYNPGFGY